VALNIAIDLEVLQLVAPADLIGLIDHRGCRESSGWCGKYSIQPDDFWNYDESGIICGLGGDEYVITLTPT
jgi:hypothetical protein